MVFICFLVGILQIIVGITCFGQYHSDLFGICIGISCILSGLIFGYIGVLGMGKVSYGYYDKHISKLREELHESKIKIKILSDKLKIKNLDALVEEQFDIESSNIKVTDMEYGFPIVLTVDKIYRGQNISKGTRCTLYEHFDDSIHVKVDDKIILPVKEDEIINAYLFDIQEKNNQKNNLKNKGK